MKTTSKVIEESGIEPSLIRSVVKQIGDKDSLRDVYNHGASGGFSGFTYYSDTVAFFKRNRKAIVNLVEQQADDLGETAIDMVAGFNCLAGGKDIVAQRKSSVGNAPSDWFRFCYGNTRDLEFEKARREYYPSVSRCLYGGRLTNEDDTQVANALAWFALEEVARAFCDE